MIAAALGDIMAKVCKRGCRPAIARRRTGMKDQLRKRYGLPMAIAMVIGIVIGSGVFFKAETVLKATGGNVSTGILAWAIVGIVMIICAYSFSILASRYEKVNGVVDYAEVMVSPRYGYYMTEIMLLPLETSIPTVYISAPPVDEY